MSEVETETAAAQNLDRRLTIDNLWHLADEGFFQNLKWSKAIASIRDNESWRLWSLRILFALGVVHILAGVIFFFAYNWADLSKDMKFMLLFGGIIASFILWWGAGPDTNAGKAGGIAATVFTGVLMAVFGQIYQTGADAFELFTAWAILTLPWAIISKSPIHIALWLLIANTAYSTFTGQVVKPVWGVSFAYSTLLYALLSGLILIVINKASENRIYLKSQWLVGLLVLGIISSLAFVGSITAAQFFSSYGEEENKALKLILLLSAQAGFFWVFREKLKIIYAAVLIVGAGISTMTLFIISAIANNLSGSSALEPFLFAIVVIAATALFLYLAKNIASQMKVEIAHD